MPSYRRAYWRRRGHDRPAYRRRRDDAGADTLGRWARLFLVLGMTHCGGGPALDDFDPLAAVEAWKERGNAPERLIAPGRTLPGSSQPFCPHPLEARYSDDDPRDARFFVRRTPSP